MTEEPVLRLESMMNASSIGFSNHIYCIDETAFQNHEKTKKFSSSHYLKQQKRVNTTHDNIHQLKVLMLLLNRGISCKYSFRLGTDTEELRNLDGIVFKYAQGKKKIFRFIQVKHKLGETKRIAAHDLLDNHTGDYNLIKLFTFYQKCKTDRLLKDGMIKDITICTNIDFDSEDLREAGIQVDQVREKDDILDVDYEVIQPKYYKIKKNITSKLKQKCQSSNDVIHEFLNHLVFAIIQPDEEEFEKIMNIEIGKEFDFIATENMYNKFLKWLQCKKKNTFSSYEEGLELIEIARREIPISFGVSTPIETFVGRQEQLKSVYSLFHDENSKIVCIKGLTGIGKSELARKYISEYSQIYDNKIVWINAETYQSIINSFRRLAYDTLSIEMKSTDGEDKDISAIVEDTYKFFSKGKSLFVFDNVDRYESRNYIDNGIDKFMPSNSNTWNVPFILIISCNQKCPEEIKVLTLNAFTEEEANYFIKKSFSIDDEDDIQELGKKLYNFPLALQQAVSYINIQDQKLKNIGKEFKIGDYLEKFARKLEEIELDNIHEKVVYATLDITLDAIKKKEHGVDALETLYLASFLVPDNIPIEILSEFVNDDEKLISIVDLLKQYSIINVDVENKVFSIHRLVQQITRMKVKEQKQEIEILEKGLRFFDKNINSETVKHALSIWYYSKEYTELVKKFSGIPTRISSKLLEICEDEEAYIFSIEISELLRSLSLEYSNFKIDLVSAKHIIITEFVSKRKYCMAFGELQELHSIESAICGPNSPMTLATKYNLAQALYKQGHFKEALIGYLEALEANSSVFGNNHPNTLKVKDSYAVLLTDLNKYDEAFEMLKEVYLAQKSMLGEDDRSTLMTKSNIASVLGKQGKSDEALQLLQEIYSIQKTLDRDDHPEIVRTKNNIANLFAQKGDFDNALKMFKEVLEVKEAVYGEDHPVVLFIRCNMAEMYHQLGRFNKAVESFKKIFEKQKDILGLDHPHVTRTQNFMARTLHHQGKFTEALPIYEEVLRKDIISIGENHPDTIDRRARIAAVHLELEQFDKALEQYFKLLEIEEKILGENDLKTIEMRAMIAMLFIKLEDYDRALQQYYELLEIEEKVLGKEHSKTIMTKNNIGMILANNKKEYDKALEILEEVLKVQEETLGPDHSLTEKIKENIELINRVKEKHDTLEETSKSVQSSITLNTGLLAAVQNNKVNKLNELVKQGANVNVKDSTNKTPLYYAIINNNSYIVDFLLKNSAQMDDELLRIASSKGYYQIVEILLQNVNRKKIVDFIDNRSTFDGTTLLHIAVKSNSLDTVKCLLKCGATYDIRNKEGKTPADLSENEEISKYFKSIEDFYEIVKSGNEINNLKALKPDDFLVMTGTRNSQGNTLLQVAIVNKHKNIASEILQMLKNLS